MNPQSIPEYAYAAFACLVCVLAVTIILVHLYVKNHRKPPATVIDLSDPRTILMLLEAEEKVRRATEVLHDWPHDLSMHAYSVAVHERRALHERLGISDTTA